MTPAPFLQDSAGPRQIVRDLPMTQRGPAEEDVYTSDLETGSTLVCRLDSLGSNYIDLTYVTEF